MTLIEVIVSALITMLIAAGGFQAVSAATTTSAEARHGTSAFAVAQQDQARLRSMRISDLANLQQTRTVTVDGTPFTVTSRGDYVTDATGTSTCAPGTAAADYLKITSQVSWPSMGNRPPALVQSIVTPPSESVTANRGGLAISVVDATSVGISGVGLQGSGAGSFNVSTGPTGCALIGNLPVGNYTLTPSLSGVVDADGNPPAPKTVSVVGLSTNTVVLQYGLAGSIQASFATKGYGATSLPTKADSVMVFNTGMTAAKSFGTVGSQALTITAGGLFPFTSPDSVYAGSCAGDAPPDGSAALQSIAVPAGGVATPPAIQLPALKVTVYQGTNTSSAKSVGATLTARDRNCGNVTRTYTTNASGQLDFPALPYSAYDICARGTSTSGVRKVTQTNWLLNRATDITAPVALNLFLRNGSTSGTCP